jgi:hypothetical protein
MSKNFHQNFKLAFTNWYPRKHKISDIYRAVSVWLIIEKNGTYLYQNDVINNGQFETFKVKFTAGEDRKNYFY